MKKISVIMSVYNENQEQLDNSISSILKQSCEDFEFIIILDNPKNTIAKQLLINYKNQDKRILFLENDKNYGLPFSLNKWINISNWKYIARMDADDVSNIYRLEKQLNFLEKNEYVDLLFTWWSELDEKWNLFKRIPKREWFKNIKKYFFIKSMLLHPTLMCKSEVLKNHQYPVTDRPEDFILFLELIKKWFKFDILEEDCFLYTIQKLNLELKFKKINVFSKNFLPVLLKNTYYYSSIYYWYFVLRIFVEFILSRNFILFKFFYIHLFNVIKKISI